MEEHSSAGRRFDILPLDLKEIKRSLPSVLQTKLIVSKENKESKPLSQSVIKPWILSPSDQVAVSRNKVAHELLHHCRNGFILDDPFIRKTRFFVDYHRMHDPGLKRYYNSIPVQNRMKKLELVTNENDAICSRKEFADYLRYLDSNLTQNINQTTKLQKERQLEENFKRFNTEKKNDAQFTAISRRRKSRFGIIADPNAMNKEKNRKLRKQIKSEQKANERMINIRNEKSQICRIKNQEKQEKFWPRKKMMIQSEKEKRIEMGIILDGKIEKARQRKESIQTEKQIEKMQEEMDYFKRHALFRQEALLKNIELYDMYQGEQRRNMEKRNRKIQEFREYNESKKIKMRSDTLKRPRRQEIVDKIMENIGKMNRKYMKRVDPSDLDEVNRRISLLTPSYVADCLEEGTIILHSLSIDVPSVVLAAIAIRALLLQVIIIPEIGATQCVVVRQRIARIIWNTVTQLRRDRVRVMKENWQRQQRRKKGVDAEKSIGVEKKSSRKNAVQVDARLTITIGEASYGEFIGTTVTALEAEKLQTTYDLNGDIKREMQHFFDHITQNKFEFSEKFNDREFLHLYDFQKYYLYKETRRFMALVKTKTCHYWNQKEKLMSWKNLDMKLDDLSNEAAISVMAYPTKHNECCEAIKKISQFVCVEIAQKLEQENITDADIDDPDDIDESPLGLSDTGSDD